MALFVRHETLVRRAWRPARRYRPWTSLTKGANGRLSTVRGSWGVGLSRQRWDAVVVGGGHNGLVAGFYIARAGLRTLILERREIVGGACVTEEFAPGFHASPGAYVLSMLRG